MSSTNSSRSKRRTSFHNSTLIFESLASILFFTVLVLGMLLLLVSILFDSVAKVHTVGVMLGMGVTRRSLVLGYLLQSYALLLDTLLWPMRG
jgi:hypothetical protein